jgi:hypothetical protein
MVGVAHNNMVEHFDFEKLPGAYQVARNPSQRYLKFSEAVPGAFCSFLLG